MAQVDLVILSLQCGEEDFKITDEGSIDKYRGILITDVGEKSF